MFATYAFLGAPRAVDYIIYIPIVGVFALQPQDRYKSTLYSTTSATPLGSKINNIQMHSRSRATH